MRLSDRRQLDEDVSGRGTAESGPVELVLGGCETTATATQQRDELFAKHSPAERVQYEVDGETGHVQSFGVVAEHVEEIVVELDDVRPLHLEHDEVDEDGQVKENVRRRDQYENNGQLEVSFIQTGASVGAWGDRGQLLQQLLLLLRLVAAVVVGDGWRRHEAAGSRVGVNRK